MPGTARQRIAEALESAPAPLTARELSMDLSLSEKDVVDHLSHLVKSTSVRIRIIPAECRSCGFVFTKAGIKKPGKCPQCKNTWIDAPAYAIEAP